jgi:hypothetical protein
MKIELSVNEATLKADLAKERSRLLRKVPQALLKTAQYGTQIILDRTSKGRGYDGIFKRYTPEYAARKKEGWPASNGGRGYYPAFSGDSSGVVNLMVTGRMLGSIQQKRVGNSEVQLYFSRATEAKKAAFNNKTRPFFGFNSQEKDRLQTFFNKVFK